jgi:anti-anti-sigma factor
VTKPLFTLDTWEVDVAGRTPATVVEVGGEVDVGNARDFDRALRDVTGARPLVTDLSRLGYIDSAGFAVLDRLLADGLVTIVLGVHSAIAAAAELMDLPSHETVATALAAMDN